jgi:hypothetical protein
LSLDNDQIVSLLEQYENESRAIREEAMRNSWYMRGGLSYETALELSPDERKIVAKIIKENLETTKKANLPFF